MLCLVVIFEAAATGSDAVLHIQLYGSVDYSEFDKISHIFFTDVSHLRCY